MIWKNCSWGRFKLYACKMFTDLGSELQFLLKVKEDLSYVLIFQVAR